MRQSGAAYDWPSTEVDDQLLSVKLTQREQGLPSAPKLMGRRQGGEVTQPGEAGWMERER